MSKRVLYDASGASPPRKGCTRIFLTLSLHSPIVSMAVSLPVVEQSIVPATASGHFHQKDLGKSGRGGQTMAPPPASHDGEHSLPMVDCCVVSGGR